MNKTLSDIRGMMRARLNEPSPGFWLNTVLNSHIQSAYNEYYQLFLQKNPEQESRTLDVTLTGGASSVALTTTGHAIAAIKVVEDRTQPELAAPISRLQSREEFIQRSMAADVTTDNGAFQYLYEVVPTVGTGVFTLTQTLFLAPIPTSSKSLRIHYAAGPQVLAGDNYTTGLPNEYEEALVWRACVIAKTQEGVIPSMLGIFTDELKRADQLARTARGPQRGNDRVQYFE